MRGAETASNNINNFPRVVVPERRVRSAASSSGSGSLVLASCAGCSRRWYSLVQGHCPTCHRQFSNVRSFDQHRAQGECRHPLVVGLQLREDDVWTRVGKDNDRWWAA